MRLVLTILIYMPFTSGTGEMGPWLAHYSTRSCDARGILQEQAFDLGLGALFSSILPSSSFMHTLALRVVFIECMLTPDHSSERLCSLGRKLASLPVNFSNTYSSQWLERSLDDRLVSIASPISSLFKEWHFVIRNWPLIFCYFIISK